MKRPTYRITGGTCTDVDTGRTWHVQPSGAWLEHIAPADDGLAADRPVELGPTGTALRKAWDDLDAHIRRDNWRRANGLIDPTSTGKASQ